MHSRRSFLAQLAAVAAAGGGAWWLRRNVLWPPVKPAFADGRSSGWLPFVEPAQGLAIVDAQVNGARVRTLLDSGAQSSVIDRSLAERFGVAKSGLGPVIVAFGVSGGPQLGGAADLQVKLGGMALPGLRAAMFELAPIAQVSQRPFGLILGQDVLEAVVADIDFPAARLAFHLRQGHVPPPGAWRVAVRRQRRQLLVPAMVEAVALDLVLDTGASNAVALSEKAARAAGLFDGRPLSHASSVGFGGVAQDRVASVHSLTFAGETLDDVEAHIFTPGRGAPIPNGLLGVQAYDHHRVIIDLAAGALYFAPGARPPPTVPRAFRALRLVRPR